MAKSPREPYYKIRFAVVGKGTFPLDMLRYDKCCPATEPDTYTIGRISGERKVDLERFSREPRRGPSFARWESFGWKVVEITYEDGSGEPGYAVKED
jgi:hypothetical protein